MKPLTRFVKRCCLIASNARYPALELYLTYVNWCINHGAAVHDQFTFLEMLEDHGFKYRLYFGRAGTRIVGYDNERGKGDHRHVLGREFSYRFTSPEQLISDFLADVEDARMKQ